MTSLPSPPPDDRCYYSEEQEAYLDCCLSYHRENTNPSTSKQQRLPLSNDHLATPPPLTLTLEEEERDDSGNDTHDELIQDFEFCDASIAFEWRSFQDIQNFLTDVGGVVSSSTAPRARKRKKTSYTKNKALYPGSFNFDGVKGYHDDKNNAQTTMDLVHHHHHHQQHPIVPRPGFYFQQTDVTNMQFLGHLLNRAVSHWCCIGFKVAPIQLDWVRRQTLPVSILYCIAAISLVSDPDQQQVSTHAKDMAITLYQKARRCVDDVFFDDMDHEQLNPSMIQSYFCLSYTSNLLRLCDHQRTWAAMAAIALQRQYQQQITLQDPNWLSCWHRWYYVDAWMSLTLDRPRLLPDNVMSIDSNDYNVSPFVRQYTYHYTNSQQQANYLHHFAVVAHFIRRYLCAFESQKLTGIASPIYYHITEAFEAWYNQLPYDTQTNPLPNLPQQNYFNPRVDIHLHLCYYAVRLVLFSRFLDEQQEDDSQAILIHNTLETNLQLLQALQYLKENKCDQSTYHHLFFAIHKAALCVFRKLQSDKNHNEEKLHMIAGEQLLMNLELLKSTPAYFNDTFNMHAFATQCMDQIKQLGLFKEQDENCAARSNKNKKKEERPLEKARHISSIHPFVSVFRVRDLDPSELRKTTLRKKRKESV